MSDNAEYDSMVSQKREAEAQAAQCERRIEECRYKIQRLERASNALAELKKDFKSIQKSTKELTKDQDKSWRGSTHDSFKILIDEVEDQGRYYYANTLDRVHDELNLEIARLKSERAEQYGLLGRLYGTINTLGTKIMNYFN